MARPGPAATRRLTRSDLLAQVLELEQQNKALATANAGIGQLTPAEARAVCITIDAELNMRGLETDTPEHDELLRSARLRLRKFGRAQP